jgi:hypothetical protein
MSGVWYRFTTISSATSLSAIAGAVLYLFGDGLPVMKTKIGVEFRKGVAEAVQSAKQLPNDLSAAGHELKYVLRQATAQISSQAKDLGRHYSGAPPQS